MREKTDIATNLVQETPIAITINHIHFSVMLASPYDLEDFAFGYLFSEGIITNHLQIHDIAITKASMGFNINVVLANKQQHEFQQQQRQLKGSSGCGLCGKQVMEMAFPTLPVLKKAPCISMQQISCLKSQLPQWQVISKNSGAMHGAFWINKDGKITACREDIGRHNAVDKIIGLAIRSTNTRKDTSILVTSRCSVEIVQKAVVCGVSSLISLAAPTQMALDFSLKHNLNLVHIPKQDAPRLLTPEMS